METNKYYASITGFEHSQETELRTEKRRKSQN